MAVAVEEEDTAWSLNLPIEQLLRDPGIIQAAHETMKTTEIEIEILLLIVIIFNNSEGNIGVVWMVLNENENDSQNEHEIEKGRQEPRRQKVDTRARITGGNNPLYAGVEIRIVIVIVIERGTEMIVIVNVSGTAAEMVVIVIMSGIVITKERGKERETVGNVNMVASEIPDHETETESRGIVETRATGQTNTRNTKHITQNRHGEYLHNME